MRPPRPAAPLSQALWEVGPEGLGGVQRFRTRPGQARGWQGWSCPGRGRAEHSCHKASLSACSGFCWASPGSEAGRPAMPGMRALSQPHKHANSFKLLVQRG